MEEKSAKIWTSRRVLLSTVYIIYLIIEKKFSSNVLFDPQQ